MNPNDSSKHLPVLGTHRKETLNFLKWYQGPDRFYHNLNHIYDCLDRYEEIRDLLMNQESVWNAIWFHDCVYSTLPGAKNEELSAAEARRWIPDEIMRQTVTRLILVTKHSDMYPVLTVDECFMCDIDLSALGSDPSQFDLNSENIRKEYSRYDDATYNAGRIDMLSHFLKRAMDGNLYYTAYFKERYEEQAKANLLREITRLRCINTDEGNAENSGSLG